MNPFLSKILIVMGPLLWFNTTMAQPVKFSYDFETKSTIPKVLELQTEFEIFENPSQDDINPSLLVGRVNKVEDETIGWSGLQVDAGHKINLKNGGYFRMKVFATTKTGTVQVKLETQPLTQHAYSLAQVTKLNQWQELTFRFKGHADFDYTHFLMVFDLGNVESHVFYFDDLEWVEGVSAPN